MYDPPASPVSLSPHAASLAKSFALVPAAAAPAVVDCVLVSSAVPPADLFHSLLLTLPDLNEPLISNQILAHTAALCHLIKNHWASPDAPRALIWRVFVPVLRATIGQKDSEFLFQVEELLCDLAADARFRELIAATLVPFCLRSIGHSMGMLQNKESSVYEWSAGDSFDEGFSGAASGTLPLLIACRVLTSLLNAALRSESGSPSWEQELSDGSGLSGSFAQNLVWDLSSMALGMLTHSLELRLCAVRLLLPHIFGSLHVLASVKVSVNGSLHTLTRVHFLRKIWKCCLSLFPLGSLERLDAYSILSLYLSSFDRVSGSANELVDNSNEGFDIGEEKEFWEEIQKGLVDKDASVRKQVLYILNISLRHYFSSNGSEYGQPFSDIAEFNTAGENIQTISHDGTRDGTVHAGMTKRGKWAEKEAKSLGVGEVCHFGDRCLTDQERWKVFILLYEMLEEYGTHLVEAAWTHQVSLLFQSRPASGSLDPITCRMYRGQMGSLEGTFSWLAILWERGLFHENPQVRCLVMQSFLGIAWDKHQNYANMVPRGFILGPFIMGLNDVVHHRDFGVKGSYTSKTIQDTMKFLRELSRRLSFSECMVLVCDFASLARQESFGRAGLMALAYCIASAACQRDSSTGTQVHDSIGRSPDVIKVQPDQQHVLANSSTSLLDSLGFVIERSKQHFNPNYRLQVCEQVLKAASSTISICDISLDVLLHFLSTIPREFTDFAGPLRGMVQLWLSEIKNQYNSIGLVDMKIHTLRNLNSFPARFIEHHSSSEVLFSFDDEDVDAWGVEAKRWARVLFFVITEEQHLEPILMFLKYHCSIICKEDIDWVPVKLLILILSLVEEFEIKWRTTCYTEATPRRSSDMTNLSEDQLAPFTSLFCEGFIRQWLLILEDLLSFAKLVSPVFWSIGMVKDTHLPCSIKGKLGGPTQRRLAPLTTSVVLHAIIAVRTISSISSWGSQLKWDDSLYPLFTFLWDFTWKVLQSPICNSETRAELNLAAYEALACVFKAFSTATSLLIDLILNYNKTSYQIGEDKPLLDSLLLSFLGNINHFLDDGVLTRSRRAILLTWKWLCLDSLLSIPYNIIEKGIHLRSGSLFFSDSTLQSAFIDIVESLENAGEDSVLPMLRSVRSLLGLLYSCRMRAIVTQSPGVDQQIMLRLVHSSWILHLSCNKRRVAPIAALLSAVLHQSVFNNVHMHETNGSKQGPLKWFIEKLLDEGEKSPRTIRLAALHLTGLWLLYPKTVKYYIKELKQLSLYGSVAFDEDFEAEVKENREAKIEVSFLAHSPDLELTEVFINTEMYARVSVAVLFFKLANLANTRRGQENEDSLASLHCGKLFLLELLDSAVNDKDLSKELYKKYSGVHRRKVRVWQMICILSHFVDEDIVNEVTSKLHICLYRNNLPAVRQYLETFAMQIYLKFPALAEEQLVPLFYDYNMRPQAVSSYVFIATNVIIHAKEQSVQTRHLNKLLPPIIPFLTSHHHSLRGFTQLLVHYVLHRVWPALESNCSEVETFEKKCLEDLKSYLEENVDCVRLRASMEGFLHAFDPVTCATPYGVFNARNEASDFECVPLSLMEQVIDFLNEVREVLRSSIAKDVVAIKNESLAVPSTCKSIEESLLVNGERASPLAFKDLAKDFQKKITLSTQQEQRTHSHIPCILPSPEFPRLLLEMEKEDLLLAPIMQSRNHVMEKIRRSQQEFILVASLLDRIPNLAGLARTCEVFKAAGLAVADASVVQDKQFQLISVTAEKWVPIIEVPVGSMKIFLEKKRQEGFSIVGLEQTANSVPLGHYPFPNKTVLVLGREKEGIPVDIIHVLDACVEIPQLGIIRSLNVHVSGAIALWEYTRQKRLQTP